MFILGFILGSLFIGITSLLIRNRKSKEQPIVEKYLRRGIYQRSFSITKGIDNTPGGSVEVVFEVGEIESTDDLSKVDVISLKADRSEYNVGEDQKRIILMIDDSWIESKDIKWINSASKMRNDKIDQILS